MNEQTKNELANLMTGALEEINVLDFGRYDENAHTEFLASILKHRRDGLFVRSFLSEMLDVAEYELQNEKYDVGTQITIKNSRRPDLVIKSESLYVIVENKVCGAGDGEAQLHDYWEHAKAQCSTNKRKPYLIYLTLAGGTPNEWSIGDIEKREIAEKGFYHERSYRHNVIDWIQKQVLPKCLHDEKSLISSLEIYLEYLTRKTGGSKDAKLTGYLIDLLQKREGPFEDASGLYAYIVQQQKYLEGEQQKLLQTGTSEELYATETVLRALEIVRLHLVNDNVFLDQAETAYHLKWILKNNPALKYKNLGHFDTRCFASIRQFTYCGAKYVECATVGKSPNVRIHIPCDANGIETGLYIFDDILSYGSSVRTDLEDLGFRYDSSGPCVFRLRHHLPPRDLIGLAKEVSEIIEKVATAVPGLQK